MHTADMLHLEGRANFIREWFPPDALPALAAAGGITGLDHESLDIAVPDASVVIT